jgi:hypothetical protein
LRAPHPSNPTGGRLPSGGMRPHCVRIFEFGFGKKGGVGASGEKNQTGASAKRASGGANAAAAVGISRTAPAAVHTLVVWAGEISTDDASS